MKRLVNALLGDAGRISFEQRIFHFTMLLAVFLTLFGTVMDFAYYRVDVAIDIIFLFVWILAYCLSRYANHFHAMSVFSTSFFVFVFLPFYWITCGGSGSIFPYYTIIFMAAICLFLSGRFRLVIVLAIMAVVLLLIGYDIISTKASQGTAFSLWPYINAGIHLTAMLASMAVLVTVYSNTYMKEKARSGEYLKTIEEQYRQQSYYMENLEKLIQQLKSERHDFNNQLGVIYGLLESGDADGAREYATGLVKAAQEYQTIVNVPYSMIRAMLNYKLSVIRETGIPLKLNINIPGGLNLNEFDITVILGNLLDNAAEACLKMDEAQRYISLCMQYKPEYLIIQTENPAVAEPAHSGGLYATTKPYTKNHGFGLANIEYLVNKHSGFIKTGQDHGIFSTDIALLVTPPV
jgi:sensor histidine kinase YesM